jgi:uncharacterized protein
MTHLRLAGAPAAMQRDALENIVRSSPTLMLTLQKARALNLPDWWIVSGAIYNQVWNHLTGRPDMYGVKDIDLFYFDPDTSYAAEDAVIKPGHTRHSRHPAGRAAQSGAGASVVYGSFRNPLPRL